MITRVQAFVATLVLLAGLGIINASVSVAQASRPRLQITCPHVVTRSAQCAPIPGNQYYSGYSVTAMPGRQIFNGGTSFPLPHINCANSFMGANGAAYVDEWVGIGGFGSAGLEQTGTEAWCTGPANGHGTAGPFYRMWYYICCVGGITLYPSQPTLHAGDSLSFSANWIPSRNQYEFAYNDHAAGKTGNAFESCPSGLSCPNGIAEVITEVPGGGPPAWTLPWGTDGSQAGLSGLGNYSSSFVKSDDGTLGTLNAQAGEWTQNSVSFMSFPGLPTPYIITGHPASLGYPDSLTNGGANFLVACTNVDTPLYSYCQ